MLDYEAGIVRGDVLPPVVVGEEPGDFGGRQMILGRYLVDGRLVSVDRIHEFKEPIEAAAIGDEAEDTKGTRHRFSRLRFYKSDVREIGGKI